VVALADRVAFGSKATADTYREEYSEHLCSDDDRRLKTVTFAGDTPEHVLERAEVEAAGGRSERSGGPGQVPLTDTEKERVGPFTPPNNYLKAASAKAILQNQGVSDWTAHYDPSLSVDEHRSLAAEQTGGLDEDLLTTQRGTRGEHRDRDHDEADVQESRARSMERGVGQRCDHAEGHCRHGDPDACEYLTDACGHTHDEVEEYLSGADDEIEGKVKGALKRAWTGYQAGVSSFEEALEALDEPWKHAQQAAKAINAIRASHGQEPLHFERLEGAQAVLADVVEEMRQDCHECHARYSTEEDERGLPESGSDAETIEDDGPAKPVGTSGECLHANCDRDADVAAVCDTGQIKHYCDGHGHGRRAGNALAEEWIRLSDDERSIPDDFDDGNDDLELAEPTPEHVAEKGYPKAAGEAQQIEAQGLFADEGDDDGPAKPDGASVEIRAGRYVKYNDWPLHINPKAHKLWAAVLTGYDTATKYNWEMEFLDKTSVDGDPHYDVSAVKEDDLVRVKAGSHSNDKTRVLRVLYQDESEMIVEKLDDTDAIEELSQ
jgi:hypothetical protein